MNLIKCPHCGAEYLPEEIFFADDLLGHPSDIVKDEEGKIKYFKDNNKEKSEEYICDYCNKTFKVSVKFQFNVQKFDDFDDEYSIKLW